MNPGDPDAGGGQVSGLKPHSKNSARNKARRESGLERKSGGWRVWTWEHDGRASRSVSKPTTYVEARWLLKQWRESRAAFLIGRPR